MPANTNNNFDGKKKRVAKQETKKQEREIIGQAKLCFKPQTPSIVVLEEKESSHSKDPSNKSQQDKQDNEEDASLEEQKGDLPQNEEEAGEDLKMSEDRVCGIDRCMSTLPKKRGRKPKVITDASSFGQPTKTQPPQGVEPSPIPVEVPEQVIITVPYSCL